MLHSRRALSRVQEHRVTRMVLAVLSRPGLDLSPLPSHPCHVVLHAGCPHLAAQARGDLGEDQLVEEGGGLGADREGRVAIRGQMSHGLGQP